MVKGPSGTLYLLPSSPLMGLGLGVQSRCCLTPSPQMELDSNKIMHPEAPREVLSSRELWLRVREISHPARHLPLPPRLETAPPREQDWAGQHRPVGIGALHPLRIPFSG